MKRKLSDRTFRALFDCSPDACLLIENNHFIDCNRAAVDMLRAGSKDRVMNTHPSVLSPPVQPDGRPSDEKADEMMAIAIREGSHRFEWVHRRMDGEEFPARVSLTLVKEGGRDILYAIWHDISGRKKDEKTIRDSYNLLNNIVNFLPYPTFIIDHKGVVLFWNKAMEDMTGLKADRIIGKGNYEYSFPFYGERRPILIDLVTKDQDEVEKKYPLIKRDRENERLFGEAYVPSLSRYWDGCASVLRNESGEVLGAIEIIRDITEEKHTKQELIEAREAAESAARVKSEFLANMSHEIRTPMNAIIGLSHLMAGTQLNGKQTDYLDKIRDSARHLLGIINDILDFSKIEAGKFVIEDVDFDLEEILDQVSNVVGHAAYKKGLELFFNIQEGIPTLLKGDPLRLGQILINLAGNAVKFTESGHVLISVEQRPRRGGKAKGQFKFSVSDTGIGITEEQKTKLFRSFSQADASVTRKYGGTGLGLAISKKLAGLMGGALGFRSRYGKGSTFFFTVPFAVRQEDKKNYGQLPDLRGMKALIVDDQDVSLEVLRTYMESMDFRVTTAQSAGEAMEILGKSTADDPFRIIIMDWKMPGLNGMDAVSAMKKDGLVDSSSVIVMVSAYSLDDVKDKTVSAGIDGFLTKPVTPSRLLDTLMNICGGKPPARKVPRGNAGGAGSVDFRGAGKVLLVEDNPINQQVAVELMENAGLRVAVAGNGREAIDMLGRDEYACILMDIQMPVMDGFEATRVIRGMQKYKHIPIIAMTAHAMAGDRERCLEAGMNDHTPKPVDPDKLFQTLGRWIFGGKYVPASGGKTAPEADDPGFPKELPGIDLQAALKLVAGNRRLFRNILLEFADTFKDACNEISAHLDRRETAEAGRLIHTIKGTAGNIGALGLQNAARLLEEGVREGDSRKTGEALHAFKGELALVIGASRTLASRTLAAGDGAAGKAPAASDGLSGEEARRLGKLLPELEEKVRGNSFDAPEFFEKIAGGAGGFAAEEMKAIGKALNGFDYDGALSHICAVLEKLKSMNS